MTIVDTIFEKAKAGYSGLYLLTSEEHLALSNIKEAGKKLERKLFIWSFGTGLFEEGQKVRNGEQPKPITDTEMPPGLLDVLTNPQLLPEKSIVVLKLFHHFLDDPLVQTRIRDLLPLYRTSRRILIILTPVLKIPPELERDITLVEVPLPGKDELKKALEGITTGLDEAKRPSTEQEADLISSALGLTTSEAQDAFSLAFVRPSIEKTTLWDSRIVMTEKCNALRKTGLLEYIPVDGEGLNSVGGLDELKDFIRVRRGAFSEAARAYGLPFPKGVLLIGPPGTGKSLGAKAVSAEFHFPLLRLDFGKIHQSLVGQSEANIRMVLQTAEALAPCVLWVDEVEKGLAGSKSDLDSGVGARVLGTLLTWMQEKKSAVYVYATANNPTLPPELIRKGRFDEMFSVDLPTDDERKEIFTIHLRKRCRYDQVVSGPDAMKYMVDASLGYTGAEIEAAIESGMFQAFDEDARSLTYADVVYALRATKPQSVTMATDIVRIREWCQRNTVPANRGDQVDLSMIPTSLGHRHLDV